MTEKIYTHPFHPHLVFHRVEGGDFMMGGADEEAESDEKPVHKVTVPTFYMGKYPVTQALWQAVTGKNPSRLKGDENRPVESVSWDDITQNFLPALQKQTGLPYRLPTESEWEYAARGGRESEGYLYAGSDKLKQVGWYNANSNRQTHPVGEKMPNELGLYDMSGNVWEWCVDHAHNDYKGAPDDGTAWLSADAGALRVLRGGSYFNGAQNCRAAYRAWDRPAFRRDLYGFRLALSSEFRGPEDRV
jgi:formylglycine-generating enzyme